MIFALLTASFEFHLLTSRIPNCGYPIDISLLEGVRQTTLMHPAYFSKDQPKEE